MAQDPLKPLDDGKIGMPGIDAGMNKMPPVEREGGKGSKKDGAAMDPADKAKLMTRIRKRMERAIGAESDNRKAALDDLKMLAGDQWPSDVAAQRNLDQRPCLTINKLPTFVHQVTNDLRQNRPAIEVSPIGEKSDVESAQVFEGMMRAIQRESAADIAYDTATHTAVAMGWGYFRLMTEYESPKSLKQVLRIKRIRNPFTVYLDPDAQEPEGADATWGFVCEMMPRDQFEDEYPDADRMPFTLAGIGEGKAIWNTKEQVRVAEYYEIEHDTRTLVLLSNGHEGFKDELGDVINERIKRGDIEVIDEREAQVPKVMWYKVTEIDVLESRETVFDWVPIIRVVGDEIDIEGKVKYSGIVRHAKDAQRMYNYWKTSETELVALAPKAPFVMEEGQAEGHEDEWQNANRRMQSVLFYKGTTIGGKPAPPPQRQAPSAVPAGVVQAAQGAAQDMQATTGIRFDATMSERMHDESGKAIHELRRSGDLGAFHFADNLGRALRHVGEMMIRAIPKVYDTRRMITILREDDTEETVQIDPAMPKAVQDGKNPVTGKVMKILNPEVGKHGVTVTIGPSYATKRIEAQESTLAFMGAIPQQAHLIADLVAKNMDWEGAEEISKRLAASLPPNLLAPNMKDVPPQVQALIHSQQQQIQTHQQQLQAAAKSLQDQQQDRALEAQRINNDFEAKLLAVAQKAEQAAMAAKGDVTSQLSELVRSVQMMHAMLQPPAPPSASGPAPQGDPAAPPPSGSAPAQRSASNA